jgi:ABC-type Fe3+ transport system substrate-binding protein
MNRGEGAMTLLLGRGLMLSAALTAAFAIAAPARAQSTFEKIATYKGADRQKILEAGARTEGTVTFYTAQIVDQTVRPLQQTFEKKYPFIQVKYIRNNPEVLLQRILAENRAAKPAADVTDSGAALAPLYDAGLLHVYWSPESDPWPADRKDPKGYWIATRYSYIGLAYNTNLVGPSDIPKSFDDLLNPKWKGKMVWSSTVHGGPLFVTAMRLHLGEEKALDYLKKLGQQNVVSSPVANRNITNAVIAGEHSLQLDAFLHHPIISAKQGAPVASKPIDPVITLSNAALLLKDAPHPHAALLFIDFMLSKEGQEVLKNALYFPASPDVSAIESLDVVVPKRLGMKENIINSDVIIREYPKSEEIYRRYFR